MKCRRFEARPTDRMLPLIAASLLLQIPLAIFLGHSFDMPIFMTAGYAVVHGMNPYLAADFRSVFGSPLFDIRSTIGYPPIWPVIAGFLYIISNAVAKSLLLYNFMLKVPILAANILLAFLVRNISLRLGASKRNARRAFVLMLFNPALLLLLTAWGQLDSMVAVLLTMSLLLFADGKYEKGALLFALSLSLKPIALPLIPLFIILSFKKSIAVGFRFCVVSAFSVTLFSAVPFLLFGWDLAVVLRHWNAHFTVAGGMSWMTFFELFGKGYDLPRAFSFLGLLWVPALTAGYFIVKPRSTDIQSLLETSMRFLLLFFLTVTWLSEPNILVLLPIVVILSAAGRFQAGIATALWLIPLLFAIPNLSLAQLLPFVTDGNQQYLNEIDAHLRVARLAARIGLVLLWQYFGWRALFFKTKKAIPA